MYRIRRSLKNKPAFTLAEVLIALVVIGIIAALTVPTLMNKTKQEQFISECKKLYSTFTQAFDLAVADYGPMNSWEITGETEPAATEFFVKRYILPYIIKAKDCGISTENTCTFKYRYYNDPNHFQFGNDWYKIVLNDGSTAIFHFYFSGDWHWVNVKVDVNGDKKPNVFGKDIFNFVYWVKRGDNKESKFEAYGVDWSREALATSEGTNACNKRSSCELCAALLMKDSWEMKDDYPL